MDFYKLPNSMLSKIDPEKAHFWALKMLKLGLLSAKPDTIFPHLENKICGIRFKNPVGLAAGFDTNGNCIDELLAQNFGFIELGTITPKPQDDIPKPRVHRLNEDQAIINRLANKNNGALRIAKRLRKKREGIIGLNICKNNNSPDNVKDFTMLFERFYNYCDYSVINISCVNIPGIRGLHSRVELKKIVHALTLSKNKILQVTHKSTPIFIKISPDLSIKELEEIAEICLLYKIDGLIIGNASIIKDNLSTKNQKKLGIVSGKPIAEITNKSISNMYLLTGGKIPIIGCGGIFSAEDAYEKILFGASLIQIYTAILYKGFDVIQEINQGLSELLIKDGFRSIKHAVGAKTNELVKV